MVSFTPRPIYPKGSRSRHSWDRRLEGTKSWSGLYGEVNNLTCLKSNFGRPARSSLLYGLSNLGSYSVSLTVKIQSIAPTWNLIIGKRIQVYLKIRNLSSYHRREVLDISRSSWVAVIYHLLRQSKMHLV